LFALVLFSSHSVQRHPKVITVKNVLLILIWAVSVSALAWDSETFQSKTSMSVDLRDHHKWAYVESITAPNLIQVKIEQSDKMATMWINPAFIDFGEYTDMGCLPQKKTHEKLRAKLFGVSTDELTKKVKQACEELQFLIGQRVSLDITNWDSPGYDGAPVAESHIFLNQESLHKKLLNTGRYKVDVSKTRDPWILNAVKESDCRDFKNAKGLNVYTEHALACETRAK